MKKLKDIMTAQVKVVPPSCTIREAAKTMKEANIGSLPVCDGDKLVGLVTDRDITIRAIAEGRDPSQITVKEIMTHPITYCLESQDVEDALRIMEVKQIRRLVVLNQQKRLVGIVTLGDVATKAYESLAGDTLGKISASGRAA